MPPIGLKITGLQVNNQRHGSLTPNFPGVNTIVKKNMLVLRPGLFDISYPVAYSITNCYTGQNTLGVMCRAELQLEKLTAIPFRFRLGSLEYVDYMEQKPNAVLSR